MPSGQLRAFGLHHRAHALDGVDDVLAGALGDFQRHGGLAVDSGEAVRVHEGAGDFRHVAHFDHAVAADLQRLVENVLHRLVKTGHLQREASRAGILGAGRDQPVGAVDGADGLRGADAVAFQQQRIDQDFDLLLAIAGDVGAQHRGNGLDVVLQIARDAQQRAFGNVAGQGDDQDREQAEIDFVRLGLVRFGRHFRPRVLDLVAHVGQRLVGIEAGLEFQQHVGAAFEGGGAHFLDALDRAQLLLQRLDQQPLGILRRDALQGDGGVDDRDVDVGLGFLRAPRCR